MSGDDWTCRDSHAFWERHNLVTNEKMDSTSELLKLHLQQTIRPFFPGLKQPGRASQRADECTDP